MAITLAEKIRIRRESRGQLEPQLPSTPESGIVSTTPVQQKIIKPVGVRRKSTPRPEMPTHLDDLDNRLLQTLVRLKFATREQLIYWSVANDITVFRRLNALQKVGLVASDSHSRPIIWTITYRGARVMLSKLPSGGRRSTWPVMSQACHRNEVEIILRSKHKGFRFVERASLWKRGLHPTFGEHCGVDDANKAYLVLLDDYLMSSDRIGRSWTRRHRPPNKFIDGCRGSTWPRVVHNFIVATTCELRAQKHEAWIKKQAIPADVITFKPLWA